MAIDHSGSLWGGPANPPCLIDSLKQAATCRPDAIAVVDGPVSITYGRLMAWAARIATDLGERGVPAGARVGVAAPRGAAAVAALVALAMSGRTYVPLDIDYPKRRLEYMLSDSGAVATLHSGDRHGLTARAAIPVPPPPAEPVGPADPAGNEPPWTVPSWIVPHHPDLPVYVIYTSGSTGLPKGVVLQHSCLDNVARWQADSSVTPDLRTAQFAPLNFDVSFQEIFGTLCAGGTLSIVPERLRRDSISFLDWLAENQIERLFLPYVGLQMLAVAASFGWPAGKLRLREINVAGEPLILTSQIVSLFDGLPRCRLANHYGQSESAMVSWHLLPAGTAAWPKLAPVGVPLPGCELLVDIADDDGVGELLVAGTPVSLGYLDRPELNAKRYITIEPTRYGHVKAFRTGDLARFANGNVELLSRIDKDVKLRGYRINLAEVEAQLMSMNNIAAAVAVVLGDGSGPRTLRSAVTLTDPGRTFDEQAVLDQLSEILPEVSVPLSVTVLGSMPTTPSGKLDRDAATSAVAAATTALASGPGIDHSGSNFAEKDRR